MLFPNVMGEDFKRLAPVVGRFHGTGPGARAQGTLRVRRGSGVAYGLGWILRLPRATEAIPVTLEVLPLPNGEHWRRYFGDQRFESRMRQQDGKLRESIWPACFSFQLLAEDGALVFHTKGCSILGVPLPRPLWPRIVVRASESVTLSESSERFTIFVEMSMPGLGRIVEYYGEMQQIK